MRIIGAGFPRTGTLSTHAALTRLGFPCYHMAEVAMRPDHTRAWHDFLCENKPMNWHELFADFEATVDAPAAFFYREIFETFPDAKIILNLREPQAWYRSYMTLSAVTEELRRARADNPALDLWLTTVETVHTLVADSFDEEDCIRAFENHNRRVQEEIPAERLLTFRVQDGWEPLCEFLGCEVPDEDFPHLNEGGDTVRAGLSAIFGLL